MSTFTFIQHIPSKLTWVTEEGLHDRINNITNYEYFDCLTFFDENGKRIVLPPKIVKECVFESYESPTQKGD